MGVQGLGASATGFVCLGFRFSGLGSMHWEFLVQSSASGIHSGMHAVFGVPAELWVESLQFKGRVLHQRILVLYRCDMRLRI